jgi:hypothetical protein
MIVHDRTRLTGGLVPNLLLWIENIEQPKDGRIKLRLAASYTEVVLMELKFCYYLETSPMVSTIIYQREL